MAKANDIVKLASGEESQPDVNEGALSITERLKRFEEAEKRLKQREAELDAREAALEAVDKEGYGLRPAESAFLGSGWDFEVGPVNPRHTIPIKKVKCADETEAIRWYVATTPHPEKPGKQVDPVTFPLKATCLSRDRELGIRREHRKAYLRRRIENGEALTPAEIIELDGETL